MIELYYWPTPNGHKVTMFLEEAGLAYDVQPVNISAGDQFKPEFLAFSSSNRMPAIIDTEPSDGGEPVTVFESGAILVYLAEKSGLFLSSELRVRKFSSGMALLAGRRIGRYGRSEPSFRNLCAREDPLCDHALRQRNQSAIWRIGPAACRAGISCW
jgi:glutathione S-transferase